MKTLKVPLSQMARNPHFNRTKQNKNHTVECLQCTCKVRLNKNSSLSVSGRYSDTKRNTTGQDKETEYCKLHNHKTG